jgi:hypothetical protein
VTRNIPSQTRHLEQSQQTSFSGAKRTVTCVICEAVYAPAQTYEYLAQTSAIALESALMSMSHFCFRCRRPACPQCWDEIHGICGACVQDARLPFRRASSPLNGALFVAAPQTQGQSEHKRYPLVCIRHGRFQRPATTLRKSTIAPIKPRRPVASSDAWAARKVSRVATGAGRPTRELPPLSQDDVAEKDTQPVHRENAVLEEKRPHHAEDIIELDTQPVFQGSVWKRIEQIATICISLLLLLLLAAILLALIFPVINTLIASALHIDIRAEIEYLLQLITHLH